MPSSDPILTHGTFGLSDDGLVLRVAGGSSWKLDDHGAIVALLGREVEVEGGRSRVDAIDCGRIWPVGKARPRRRHAVRTEFALVAGLMILGYVAPLLALFG